MPPPCHRRHYKLGYQGSIVPPMALAEAQVVILYFFGIKYNYIDHSNQIHLVLVDVIMENIYPLFKRTTRINNSDIW